MSQPFKNAHVMGAGQKLVRINLSEQTDMMDLLGADLPVQGGAPGQFAWSAPYPPPSPRPLPSLPPSCHCTASKTATTVHSAWTSCLACTPDCQQANLIQLCAC